MTVSIEKAREVFDYVHLASIDMFNAARGKDAAANDCLLFLVRAINAAEAARVLFEEGYELESMGVNRVIIEAFIEFSFISGDPTQQAARMKLFHDHAAFGIYKEARNIAKLHGMPATDPNLMQLETRWKAVEANYGTRPWIWCSAFDTLKKRAIEAGRVFDERKAKAAGQPSTEYAQSFERTYELAFAEGCMAAHMSPDSFYQLPQSVIGPSKPTDGHKLVWIAWSLARLTDAIGLAVKHLPESILAKSVAMV